MDDKKMKIRVVVQPEETRRAAEAAEREREARLRRNRYGLLALSGLVAIGLLAALIFFLGGGDDEPVVAEQSAPAASSPAQPGAPAPSGRQDAPPMGASLAEAPTPGTSGAAPGAAPGAPHERTGTEQSGQAPALAPAPGAASSGKAQEGADAAVKPAPAAESEPAGNGDTADKEATPTAPPASTSGPGSTSTPSPPAAPAPSPVPAPSRAGAGAGAGAGTMAPTPAPASKGAAKSAPAPAKASAAVARAQLTSRVVGREPIDTLRSPIAAQSGRDVYYFTEFRDLKGHTVFHRWEHDGDVLAQIPFKIGGDRWRVYSSKRVWPNQLGPWRVMAIDKNGTVLATADFVVE